MGASSYIDSHKTPGKGAYYDNFYRTDSWHQYVWSWEQRILDRILTEFFHDTPVDLLDFACGTGRIAGALEEKVRSATGVDVSDAMLVEARHKLQRTELVNGNLLQQDLFPGRQFNLITAFRFFVNAEPELRSAALKAIEAKLAPGGALILNNHQNQDAPYTKVLHAYARARGLPVGNSLTIGQCRALLAEVGMEIVKIYPAGMLHVPKLGMPHFIYRAADRVAAVTQGVAGRSESPIIVAQRTSESRKSA